MNTFNVSFIVGRGALLGAAVVTIVCASEDEIDREMVRSAMMRYFQCASLPGRNLDEVFRSVVTSIQEEFGIQAVIVSADCATFISL